MYNKIKEYNAKCSLMGIKPLRIDLFEGEVIAYSEDVTIKKCIIPNFVTKLGGQSFLEHRQLEEIDIPDSVITIAEGHLWNVGHLKK